MIVIVVGRRGQGKTTLGCSIAKKCESRVFLDTRRTFPTRDPVGDLPGDRVKLTDQMNDPDWPEIVVQPRKHFEETNEYLAGMLADLMLDPNGRIAILLDEAGLIDFGPWDAYFRTAHPQNVVLIVTAHRLQDIPPKVRALADWFCLFRTTEPNDLKLIENQCSRRVADLLPMLEPRVFVRYDAGATSDDQQIQVFRDPSKWYVPMHQPQFAAARVAMDGGEDVRVTRDTGLF